MSWRRIYNRHSWQQVDILGRFTKRSHAQVVQQNGRHGSLGRKRISGIYHISYWYMKNNFMFRLNYYLFFVTATCEIQFSTKIVYIRQSTIASYQWFNSSCIHRASEVSFVKISRRISHRFMIAKNLYEGCKYLHPDVYRMKGQK